MIDSAASGATVNLPACVFREAVVITKPVILIGHGTEIRGSDIWSEGWRLAGGLWVHAGLPHFPPEDAPCDGDGQQCDRPEQVYSDGHPLVRVLGTPSSGQFAVTPDHSVVLADAPAGHVVEVTVRPAWVDVRSSGVTIRGFTMRHAANLPQTGAIDSEGFSGVRLENNVLSDAHGAVISLRNGSHLQIIDNDIGRGGQEGVHLSRPTDSVVGGNRIHDNNVDGFSSGWEAGGLKAAGAARLTLDGNDVYANRGPGLWCDGDCHRTIYRNNRVHDNTGEGIKDEISHEAIIVGNTVWRNGWGFHVWAWGAGIMVQNSEDCTVERNTLAWNAKGVSVIEQRRQFASGRPALVANTLIHDNMIVMQDREGPVGLAFVADYPSGMFAPERHNRGDRNAFGYAGAPEGPGRFAWQVEYSSLAGFNSTPGGGGTSRYMTAAEERQTLRAAGLSPASLGPRLEDSSDILHR